MYANNAHVACLQASQFQLACYLADVGLGLDIVFYWLTITWLTKHRLDTQTQAEA